MVIFDSYTGYDAKINASVTHEFATAINRFGHAMISHQIKILNHNDVQVRDIFFNVKLVETIELGNILSGLVQQKMKKISPKIVDALRQFLFSPPQTFTNMFFDLAAIDMQRGRDHGIVDYNSLRDCLGLQKYTQFEQISSDKDIVDRLQVLYGAINKIDPWIGALAEDHAPNSAVGTLLQAGLKEQFDRLRKGDRFWYENDHALKQYNDLISKTKLSNIILRNTEITDIPDNVFLYCENNKTYNH